MKIAIGSDHAGFEIKERLKEYLKSKGYEIIDKGTNSSERCDYPDYAFAVAKDVSEGKVDRGILICGTGIGMSITANKLPNIRASLCFSEETAELSRAHNNANILCLGARILDYELITKIVDIWFSTKFEQGRHERRIEKIKEIEKEIHKK